MQVAHYHYKYQHKYHAGDSEISGAVNAGSYSILASFRLLARFKGTLQARWHRHIWMQSKRYSSSSLPTSYLPILSAQTLLGRQRGLDQHHLGVLRPGGGGATTGGSGGVQVVGPW